MTVPVTPPAAPTQPPALPIPELKDIILPAPVSWWPPALGWWVLAALALILLLALAIWLWRRWRRERWRRTARRELLALQPLPPEQALQQLRELLKRVARVCHPTAGTDGMTGTQWMAFLGRTGPMEEAAWRPLVESAFRPDTDVDLGTEVQRVRRWVEAQP